ncbi:uncharacterized protein LOC116422349 [Sarcophilus harrisii]|uniref:uncharacterized protein LOC116422349 n=1 Tax=Sarcophilus harrisii TaxID=9305 RepID=UPI001301DABA|nr:uncharacterized protein LOC116422349 [Sarcophilus harrisii]XP_031815303.1 uncharacterized protein LOC116422349 [Sarcophilus harrisii]
MAYFKHQIITIKSSPHHLNDRSQLTDSGLQEKAVPLVSKKKTNKLSQQTNPEKHSGLLFRSRTPRSGILYPRDHQANIVTLRPYSSKTRARDGPAISNRKTEPNPSPSKAWKVTSELRGKKLSRATVTTAHYPDPSSKTTTKRQASAARNQAWKKLHSEQQGKQNLGSNEQAKLKVASQHQPNSPNESSTHLLNRFQKITPPGPETKTKKQLIKRSWTKFFHDYNNQTMIPLRHQCQTEFALGLVSDDLLPLNRTYIKSEGPLSICMVCGCQKTFKPYIVPRAKTPPCQVCSSRSQSRKTQSRPDASTPMSLPMLEPRSRVPLHPKVQDIPVPKKLALPLTDTPKRRYYQTKATQISDYQNEEQDQVQTKQKRSASRYLFNIKPYTIEGQTHNTKFVDDIISPFPREKPKSNFSNEVRVWQMKDYPRRTHWTNRYLSANDNSGLACSWLPKNSYRVDRKITVPTSLPSPQKKRVKFLVEMPQSKNYPSLENQSIFSSKRRLLYPTPVFPLCSYSETVPLAPLKPKLTWLDFIRYKYRQRNEERASPSQKLYEREMPYTSRNSIREMSVRQNPCHISLLKKFESRINN